MILILSVVPAKAGTQVRMLKQPAVYILASKRNGTLYIGVTSNLAERIWQHKNGFIEGFTKEHKIHLLVYYEFHDNMLTAIAREKQMKKWNRAWKLNLIEEQNPDWRDLSNDI
jgi:putative endonuclease